MPRLDRPAPRVLRRRAGRRWRGGLQCRREQAASGIFGVWAEFVDCPCCSPVICPRCRGVGGRGDTRWPRPQRTVRLGRAARPLNSGDAAAGRLKNARKSPGARRHAGVRAAVGRAGGGARVARAAAAGSWCRLLWVHGHRLSSGLRCHDEFQRGWHDDCAARRST